MPMNQVIELSSNNSSGGENRRTQTIQTKSTALDDLLNVGAVRERQSRSF